MIIFYFLFFIFIKLYTLPQITKEVKSNEIIITTDYSNSLTYKSFHLIMLVILLFIFVKIFYFLKTDIYWNDLLKLTILISFSFLISFFFIFTIAKYFDIFHYNLLLRRTVIWLSIILFVYIRRNNLIISDIKYDILSIYNYFIYFTPVLIFGTLYDLELIWFLLSLLFISMVPNDIYNYITGGYILKIFKNKDNYKILFVFILVTAGLIILIFFPSESKAASKIPWSTIATGFNARSMGIMTGIMIDQHFFGTSTAPTSNILKTRTITRYDQYGTILRQVKIEYYKEGNTTIRKILK